jgi:hypothetical protein
MKDGVSFEIKGNRGQTTVSKFSEQKKQDNRGLSFILLFFQGTLRNRRDPEL